MNTASRRPISYGQERQFNKDELKEIRDAINGNVAAIRANGGIGGAVDVFDYPDYGGLESAISGKLTSDEVDAIQDHVCYAVAVGHRYPDLTFMSAAGILAAYGHCG